MIFKPVKKYSLVNAKVRARLSTLLGNKEIMDLVQAGDLSEFYAAMSSTVYEDIFSSPRLKFDPRIGEKMLLEKEISWHIELTRDLRGPERELVEHFLQRYEIENLKTALRIRERERGEEEMKYLVDNGLPHRLDYMKISQCPSMEEVIPLLSGTPYQVSVERAYPEYQERETLFPVEVELELDFFRELNQKIESLDRRDRKPARKLMGLEIDRKNISWLIRLRFYYDFPVGSLMHYNIPGGLSLTRERLREAFASETIYGVLTGAMEKSFPRGASFISRGEELGRLYLMEIILWNYLLVEARKTLGGFPFTIGTVLAYLILKRTEVRNIITILNGKVYGMEGGDIEGHLRGAF